MRGRGRRGRGCAAVLRAAAVVRVLALVHQDGEEADADDDGEPALVEREDGSLLVAGWMAADSLAERLGLTLPEDRDYATAAGLVLETLKHIPETGEWFEAQGWRFEVIDMDGRKIDKLLVSSTR